MGETKVGFMEKVAVSGDETVTPVPSCPTPGCLGPVVPPSSPVAAAAISEPSLLHRMTADGFLQSVGRLGAMAGPLIKMTGQVLPLMPPLTYGALPIAASLVLLLSLPETKGIPLPDTIRDLEGR